MGMVAASPHQSGRKISTASPSTVNVSQKIFRFTVDPARPRYSLPGTGLNYRTASARHSPTQATRNWRGEAQMSGFVRFLSGVCQVIFENPTSV